MHATNRGDDAVSKIVPFLWYADKAEEAAAFYVSLLPGSRVDNVTNMPADSPSGPAGSVQLVEFTLAGQQFVAMNAGPLDPFNHAISFLVNCADQARSTGCGRPCRKAARPSSAAG
jgi:predicted 3-demethylubiquinone-9 3-methyltransferase (glyoxalase superfamily)